MTNRTAQGRAARGRLAALGITAALVLTACGGGSDDTSEGGDSDLGDVTVQLSWVKNAEFAGEFFAEENGYFADAGLGTVTLVPGPGATENLVASGEADFGTANAVSTGQVIAEEGAPLKIVGSKFQRNPFTILSLTDGADIATPEDLVGKTIGVQPGGNEALFSALLEVNDIDEADVETVPVEYDPSPLVDGEVDGFFAYVTNESITVEELGHEVTNLLLNDNGLPFVAEAIIATDETISERPEVVKAYLEASIRGWQDALADPDEGARLAVEVYGKDLDLDMTKEARQAEIQNELVLTDDVEQNGLFTITDQLMNESIDSLARAGIEVTVDDLFDLSLLEELLEEQPELRSITAS
ncbi:ABC transporter substrate-binding protein [Aeromicrobium sp. PE09-221]|uniref:ABC transporter substrate-binding protein n=1 Tax=Aeromicrobium sp. PE09-221 TaxID=1898043 RepID=UPI000B3EB632|nr:ABC transporter substrate-binding protein [Aeromicrobium sp. PE09-221]OUZ08016.1 ABC transporter substrate-binding protein [Aeromicrobium sp. PE09-221]